MRKQIIKKLKKRRITLVIARTRVNSILVIHT